MRTFLLTLVSIFFFSGVAMSQPAKHYVVFHKEGPKWPKGGLAFSDPIAQEHAAYFGKLHGEGVVIQGGPFPGNAGGMMIFKEGSSMEEVTQLASEDPAVKKGVMSFEVKMWMRVFRD